VNKRERRVARKQVDVDLLAAEDTNDQARRLGYVDHEWDVWLRRYMLHLVRTLREMK
jgi:hypothetical protein